MAKTNSFKRKELIELIKALDESLLQRVSDFTNGLLAGSESQDWWDELSSQQKKHLKQSAQEAKKGLGTSFEEVIKKY